MWKEELVAWEEEQVQVEMEVTEVLEVMEALEALLVAIQPKNRTATRTRTETRSMEPVQ